MAKEDTFLPGQLPIGIFDEGGKFEPKQEFIDAARAKALEEGKKYYGDATNFETFRDSVLNLPDATINFLARGAEGTGELAAGIASLAMKGAKLATTTDPDKITQILSEPSFTKYMGAFRDKIPTKDLYESDISGIEDTEEAFGDVAYYASPLPVVPAGVLAAGAKSVAVPAGRGIAQLADDIVKSFTRGDSGFRASAGGKKTGVKTIDEMIEDKTLKTGDELTQDPLNLVPIKNTRLDAVREAYKNKMIQQAKTQLNTKGVKEILENMRTGKISQSDGINQLNAMFPGQAMGSNIKAGRGFIRLRDLYNSTRTKKKNDIFDMEIEGRDGNIIGNVRKKQIFDAINAAEKSKSKEPFAIKFANEYHKLTRGEDQPIKKISTTEKDSIKAVLKAMNKEKRIEELDLANIAETSEDGTYYVQKEQKIFSAEAWNKVKVGEIIPSGEATKKLKNTILSEGSEKSFSKVKTEIFGNNIISSKIKRLDELFEDLGKEHVYSLDHIQPKLFGGTDNTDNLRFIVEGPHNSGKKLDPDATFIGDTTVANKSAFEADIYSKAKEITELVKKGDLEKAREISEEINKLQNNFKNTYDNIDFVIGEAYVPIKTGDTTAKYIKYSEYLKLTPAQQKQVSELIPRYENLPNKNVSIEKSLDKVIDVYRDAAQDFPGGKIERDFISQIAPEGKREGGMMSIFDMIQPVNAQR